MAKYITVDMAFGQDVDKRDFSVGVISPKPVSDSIIVVIGDDVDYRQVETLNALKWLWNGVRDRDLLDSGVSVPGNGQLVSACNIDAISPANRRTAWGDTVVLTEGDVGIMVGTDMFGQGAINYLESAFKAAIDFTRENWETIRGIS